MLCIDFPLHNIQRITKQIQSKVDYNFFNPGYTYFEAFQDDFVLLKQHDKKLKHICPHFLLVLRYPLFFNSGHLCRLYEIYTYKVEKINFLTPFYEDV